MATATAAKPETKPAVKSSSKKSDTQLTNFLSDLVEVTKDVVDDVVDVAGKVEKSARARSKDAREKLLPTDKDMKRLRKRTQDLTDAAERLITFRGSKDSSSK